MTSSLEHDYLYPKSVLVNMGEITKVKSTTPDKKLISSKNVYIRVQ